MNENLDLCLILKGCPKGTKFWSPIWGDVILNEIKDGSSMPIKLTSVCTYRISLYPNGKMYDLKEAECVLFPSKTQRDWSKFKGPIKKFNPKEFKPFDKVLIRDGSLYAWKPSFFANISTKPSGKCYAVDISYGCIWMMCIPYNEETKHLCGTTDDCPDCYKWWEE